MSRRNRHQNRNKNQASSVERQVDQYLQVALKDLTAKQDQRRAMATAPITTAQPNRMRLPYRAAQNKRTANPWPIINLPTGISDDAGRMDLRSIRSRARFLEQNNKWAKSILAARADGVVGPTGFGHRATTQDKQWNAKADAKWAEWTEAADCAGGSWVDFQYASFKNMDRDGDSSILLLNDGTIQGVEGHRLRSPADKTMAAKGNRIVDGVEINAVTGKPAAYWFSAGDYDDAGDPQRVDAKDVIFLAREKSWSSTRGESIFINIADTLDTLNDLDDIALIKEKIAACYALIYKMKDPQSYVDSSPYMLTDGGAVQHRGKDISPGMIDTIAHDESVEQFEPKASGQNLVEFMRQGVRSVGGAIRMPYEAIALDYSQGSFVSVKAALLQGHVPLRKEQHRFIAICLRKLYRWKIDQWIESGDLEDIPDKYSAQFIPAQFPFIDPVDEMRFLLMQRDAGIATQAEQLRSVGKDFDQWAAESGFELATRRANGLPNTHSMLTGDFDQFKTNLSLPDTEGELKQETEPTGERTDDDNE